MKSPWQWKDEHKDSLLERGKGNGPFFFCCCWLWRSSFRSFGFRHQLGFWDFLRKSRRTKTDKKLIQHYNELKKIKFCFKGPIGLKHPRTLNYMEANALVKTLNLRSSKPLESLETSHVSIYITVSLMCRKTLTIYYWFIDNLVMSQKSRRGTSATVGFIIDVQRLSQKSEVISQATQEFGSYTTVVLNGDVEVSESRKVS